MIALTRGGRKPFHYVRIPPGGQVGCNNVVVFPSKLQRNRCIPAHGLAGQRDSALQYRREFNPGLRRLFRRSMVQRPMAVHPTPLVHCSLRIVSHRSSHIDLG